MTLASRTLQRWGRPQQCRRSPRSGTFPERVRSRLRGSARAQEGDAGTPAVPGPLLPALRSLLPLLPGLTPHPGTSLPALPVPRPWARRVCQGGAPRAPRCLRFNPPSSVKQSLKQRTPPLENSHKPEKEWPVRNLKVYLGIKKKLRPPTCWGFTVFYENEKHEKQQWYLCCDTQADLREWFATFLQVQHGGALWPSESCQARASRARQDSRLGHVSLIPLRGNESEMRSSVAAFAADPLTLLRNA